MEEEIKEEVNGETQTPSEEPQEPQVDTSEEERMFTQSQLNEIVGKARMEARERATLEKMFERYGVSDEEELNSIFGKGQAYDVINDELASIRAENALLKSGIKDSRWEDAKAILGNKGLEINEANILAELETHPEWSEEPSQAAAPTPSIIRRLGESVEDKMQGESEEAKLKRIFNL